jgi:outer membrane protein TolC
MDILWAGLLGLILLVTLQGGCAHVRLPVSEAALVERILPPPDIADLPPPTNDPPAAPPPINPKSPSTVGRPPQATDPELAIVDRVSTRPLMLDDAISLAFQYQPRLRIFQEDIEQARGRSTIAFAPFLPRANLLAESFFSNNPNGPPDGVAPPAPEFGDARDYQNYGLEELLIQWTLWDFGRTYGRYQQATLGISIAQLQAIRASQTVAYEVTAAYYRVLQARATRRVAEEAVRRAEAILDIARKSLQAGLFERDQVLRAQVELAHEQRAVVAADRTERVAVAALNLAIGLNVSAPTDIVDRTDEPPFALSLAECLQRAVDNRREFQVAEQDIEVAAEGERVTRADFAPRIYVQGMVAAEDGHRTLHGMSESSSIDIGWSLFQGGQRLGALRVASAALRAAAAQAQVICDHIAYEVNAAYRDLEAARQSITLARPAITQARENLRLVTKKYEHGDATPTDIVDAETSLTRAQQDYYNALYDYLTALARLEYAMGVTPFLPAEGGK